MTTIYCIRPKGFNVGNDAIFLAMQPYLYGAFGEVVNLISVPATSRYESQAKAGLTPRTIHEINQYGDGLIIGGGNLYENGELDVNLHALKRLEVPLMLFSLSWGRIFNRHGNLVSRTDAMPDAVIQGLHEKAVVSLTRDEATRTHLQSIGCSQAATGGCPTIFLNRFESRLPALAESTRGDALISVRNPSLMNVPVPRQARVRDDILRIVALLRDQGCPDVRLLCHDHRDIEFAASFDELEYVYTGDIYSYLAVLRACRLHVSYRLHATLPCLAFGKPSIKISYDERALSLMQTLGLAEWNINMMSCASVPDAVAQRLQALDRFPALLSGWRTTWAQYDRIMTGAFDTFGRAVREQA